MDAERMPPAFIKTYYASTKTMVRTRRVTECPLRFSTAFDKSEFNLPVLHSSALGLGVKYRHVEYAGFLCWHVDIPNLRSCTFHPVLSPLAKNGLGD